MAAIKRFKDLKEGTIFHFVRYSGEESPAFKVVRENYINYYGHPSTDIMELGTNYVQSYSSNRTLKDLVTIVTPTTRTEIDFVNILKNNKMQEEKLKRIAVLETIIAENKADLQLEDDNEQIKILQAATQKAEAEVSQLKASMPAAPKATPSVPTPKKGEVKTKEEWSDAKKAEFAANMKAKREAKAVERAKGGESSPSKPSKPKPSKSAEMPSYKGIGQFVGSGKIPCGFDIWHNNTGKTVEVPNVNGTMEAKEGDYIMYLPEGDSFTVIKKTAFAKRCLIVTPAAHAPTPTPSVPEPKKAASVPEPPKASEPKHAHVAAAAVVAQMKKEGCDVHEFVKEVKGTPLDAWIQGKIMEYTSGKTEEYIERIYIDSEKGDLYAKISFKSAAGWFMLPRYVQVCPERGIETIVNAKDVEGKKYRVQYGSDKLRAMYHYPEDVAGCRGIAKEIYAIRQKNAIGDAKALYDKYQDRCRNPEWTKQYKKFIRWFHDQAIIERKGRPTMSHGEALGQVAGEFKAAARAAA